ncbi:Replicase polyprotein 1ab [Kineococcus terrestris]|uniref:Replicase polyprotein 1ab n=1 Tax=Kineococcus terrestris TaxID=2044856 RepID=UPI0034DB4EAE
MAPRIPDEITGRELAVDVRKSLQSLTAENADVVARHLVASGQLVDVDPEAAWQHALAAQRRGGRVAAVREAGAIAAYRAGHFREALAELRTVRRMTGDDSYLPLMADCERGLGRPERAIDLSRAPEVENLDAAARVEMLIVAAGARADLGQHDAAVVALQVPQLRTRTKAPWRARLWYAYADALLAVGRDAEGREWLERAAEADTEGETDAAERLEELDGLVFSEEEFEDDELDDEQDEDEQDEDEQDEDDGPGDDGPGDDGPGDDGPGDDGPGDDEPDADDEAPRTGGES